VKQASGINSMKNKAEKTENILLIEQSSNNNTVPISARAYTSRMVEREVPLAEISPHPENPRFHPEEQIKQLKASHENLGQFEPVILWQRPKGYIQVKGHGYGEGAKQAGDTKTRAWILPEDTPEAVVKQIMLASNLHGQNSHDDEDVLARLLKEQKDAGTDLTALGSDDESLRQLLAEVNREHATDFLDGVLKAPREDEEGEEDGEEGYGTMPLSNSDASFPQYFQVAYSLTAEQRTTVLDAFKKAKQRYELQTSNQALVQICTEFLRGDI
jgi:hypothetical protein